MSKVIEGLLAGLQKGLNKTSNEGLDSLTRALEQLTAAIQVERERRFAILMNTESNSNE